ncbi:MAG: polyketide synthase dehydratase domain-containing protein, partial [Actinomycetota bacterium]|nr:polyketide synthase dehydratase domain-containing protein [Actinomycetota bacterium]
SLGVRADVLIGHSIGELAAAYVSGVLSLRDACAVVNARARLMQALPEGGVMAAVRAAEDEITLVEGVAIGAINAPGSVVLSGTREAVETAAAGRRTTWLRVSHAFHSPLMEPMLAEFAAAIDGITVNPPQIPIVSTVGECEDFGTVAYWVRQVREPVRFADAVREARAARILEVGPDGSLTAGYDGIAMNPLPAGLSRAWVAGVDVDWAAFFTGADAPAVTLPTYAFQRRRYWPTPTGRTGDATGLGLTATTHPLLAATLAHADGSGLLLTGRLNPAVQPWLRDHRVAGTVLLPATALLELAVRAGDEAGCEQVEELTLMAPLVLPEHGGIAVQVRLTGPDATGRRRIGIHSLPEGAEDWATHASGTLLPAAGRAGEGFAAAWPPAGAEPVSIEECYARFESAGFGYGPAFHGLRGVWRADDDVYAEVALPEVAGAADAYGLHPALLDAALHALLVTREAGAGQRLPFSWQGVTLHASGATALRVRLTPRGDDAVAIEATDPAGRPVLSVTALEDRAMAAGPAAPATDTGLFRVAWRPAPAGLEPVRAIDDLVPLPVTVTGDGPADVEAVTAQVLAAAHAWLDDAQAAARTLVVVTRGANGPGVTHPAAAAVWGLIRSAQSEHPGRFALLDVEDDAGLELALPVLAADEPQVAVRGGVAHVARLTRPDTAVLTPPPTGSWRLSATGGGLGGLALTADPDAGRPLTDAQVRIRVAAAGLNFRDVLTALGMYPGEAGALGAEAVGVVVGVGPLVTR